MKFRWRGRNRWLWGTLATWTIQRHIACEIRPEVEATEGATRDIAVQVFKDRIEFHFDRAWPVK